MSKGECRNKHNEVVGNIVRRENMRESRREGVRIRERGIGKGGRVGKVEINVGAG